MALAGFYSLPVNNSFWLSALIKAASFCFLKYIRFLPDWWLSRLRTAPPAKYLNEWKSLSRVWLFATPWPIQSIEFSRPEYWSGLPFPFFRGSSQPRDRTQVSCIAGNSLPAEPQGKPKNTGFISTYLLGWERQPIPVFCTAELHGLYGVSKSQTILSNFHYLSFELLFPAMSD